ncbi:Vacuolar protein-sorting-associated protein 11-like protein [Smittium mucronatum]|uniref:Vacuolar protein-sorting-associated protein 11-like protein n=1 Tax=Smittium mucronatum TaxID=133383 RepID=A0A1R0H4U0_9FUNG|nr:Vacuolar protein-sorting-associated protein 11-like protein [Smittium mucronatum]
MDTPLVVKYKNPLSRTDSIDTSVDQRTSTFVIINTKNKLIACKSRIAGGIRDISINWNGIFVFGNLGSLDYFEEADLRTKIDCVTKQNMYSVALNLVSQSSDENIPELSAQIHLKQGEYLLERNEPELAISEYINTIGQIDPSFVIVKLLDVQYLGILITYLESLVDQNFASNDHLMLLLTCYSKHGDETKLVNFLERKVSTVPSNDSSYFDVNTAIEVCLKEGRLSSALRIAEKFHNNQAVLNIMVYKMFDFKKALEFLSSIFANDSGDNIPSDPIVLEENISLVKKFGRVLLSNLPHEFTDFLVGLCVSFRIDPTTMKHLYVGCPQYLILFYESYSIMDCGFDILKSPIEDYFSKIERSPNIPIPIPAPAPVPDTDENLASSPLNPENELINNIYKNLLELYLVRIGAPINLVPQIPNPSLFRASSPHPNINPDAKTILSTRKKALKLMRLLSNPKFSPSEKPFDSDEMNPKFDYDYIYMLCSKENFTEGLVFLNELNSKKSPMDLLNFYFDAISSFNFSDDTKSIDSILESIFSLLNKHSGDNLNNKSNDDKKGINSVSHNILTEHSKPLFKLALIKFRFLLNENDPEVKSKITTALNSCLNLIKRDNIISPIEVLELLLVDNSEKDIQIGNFNNSTADASGEIFENNEPENAKNSIDNTSTITIGMIKDYLLKNFDDYEHELKQNKTAINQYNSEINSISDQINELLYEPILFDPPNKCDSCHLPLNLPTINFFCKHTYHYNCLHFAGSGEELKDGDDVKLSCPICKAQHLIAQENYLGSKDALA